MHPSGNFVLVANRGHDSLCVYKIDHNSRDSASPDGTLGKPMFWHSGGETPRHFQFDPSGQWLLVANQDSDNISIFRFNISSGQIEKKAHSYRVPSPNFVCCFQAFGRD